jgi:pilus assembly protein CpaF
VTARRDDLIERVRGRLASSGKEITSAVVADAVREEAGGVLGHADLLAAMGTLRQELIGAGPLDPLLRDLDTTDILVSGAGAVWVDGPEGLRPTEIRFPDEESVRRLAQRLAMAAGRRLDDAQPFVDAWLPDTGPAGQVRLHAVLPPIAADGTSLSLRVLRPARHDLQTLQVVHTFDAELLAVLESVVDARLAFLISGGTGSGKTTLLAAMLSRVPDHERIVCVEDAGELQPCHPQFVRLIARPANVEGAGEVTLADLVRQGLRMRPDRIVVGEVRGAEVCELLAALNTGHDGGAGTVHANSPVEVPARLEALAALGGLHRAALHSQLSAALQVVLHMRRGPDGARRLSEIGVLERSSGIPRVQPVWQHGSWLPARSALADLLTARGVPTPW